MAMGRGSSSLVDVEDEDEDCWAGDVAEMFVQHPNLERQVDATRNLSDVAA